MPGFKSIFDFRSAKAKQQDEEDFAKRMAPFGPRQKEYEQNLLKQMIHSKVSPEEKMFQLLVIKDALEETDDVEQVKKLKKWYNNSLFKKFSEEDRAITVAIAMLEKEAESFEDLPDEEKVMARAETVQKTLLPTLKKTGLFF